MTPIQTRALRKKRPIRVAQFGEGNFLRAFADYMIDVANEQGVFDGNVAVVKPTSRGNLARFWNQDNFYTVMLRGQAGGRVVDDARIITCLEEVTSPYEDGEYLARLGRCDTLQFVISNTTEAGIALTGDEQFTDRPAASFPGKLTQLMYARYEHFRGEKPLTILPTELIEDNGGKLRACVLTLAEKWGLDAGFAQWVQEQCVFCNTLVDRIVTGHPAGAEALAEKLGYEDELLDAGEPFGLWVIECGEPEALAERFPLHKAGLPVIFTKDLTPYRERKVRILNGAHTSSVLAAYLCGEDIVRNMMHNPLTRAYVEKAVYEELLPTVKLPEDEVRAFAASVMERFENPFIDHALLSISLNSVSKWRARVLPSLKDNVAANGCLPTCLTFSLAALIAFYRPVERENGQLIALRGEEKYAVRDDQPVMDFFWENRADCCSPEFVKALCAREDFWGEDLGNIPGLTDAVAGWLEVIRAEGMREAVRRATGDK